MRDFLAGRNHSHALYALSRVNSGVGVRSDCDAGWYSDAPLDCLSK